MQPTGNVIDFNMVKKRLTQPPPVPDARLLRFGILTPTTGFRFRPLTESERAALTTIGPDGELFHAPRGVDLRCWVCEREAAWVLFPVSTSPDRMLAYCRRCACA